MYNTYLITQSRTSLSPTTTPIIYSNSFISVLFSWDYSIGGLGNILEIFPKVFRKYRKDKTWLYSKYPVLETEIGPECPAFLRWYVVVLLNRLFYSLSHIPCQQEYTKIKQTNFSWKKLYIFFKQDLS